MNSEPNQGSKLTNGLGAVELPVAARAGIMHTTYTCHRASQFWDTRAARWRITDGDEDGVLSGSDCNDADPPFDDGSAPPAAGSGVYYLVRGQHACTGSYGNSGQAVDPRDGLDLTGPCP